MIIGDRLRALREGKNSPKVTSKRERVFSGAISLGSRMVMAFPRLKPWRMASLADIIREC